MPRIGLGIDIARRGAGISWQAYWTQQDAFNIPAVAYYLPVGATTGWTMRRTGGDPAAAISAVDNDATESDRFNTTKHIKFITGATGHAFNAAIYTFPVGSTPYNFTGKQILFWVKFEEGEGISLWSKAPGFYVQLAKDSSNFRQYTIGAVNVQYASSGWYAFSFTPTYGYAETGTAGLDEITSIRFGVSKVATDSPIIHIGKTAIVDKPSVAQLCLTFDNDHASHKTAADFLTTNSMKGSFFIDKLEGMNQSDVLAMQSNGHLIGVYARNWAADITDTDATILKLTVPQAFLKLNGFTGGRYFVHGITSAMTEELWQEVIYQHAYAMVYMCSHLTSPYHKNYIGRYNEFNAANAAACVTLVNAAVTDGARAGLLIHSLVGADMTAFETFITDTIAPLVTAGTLEVITVKEAYEKSLLF